MTAETCEMCRFWLRDYHCDSVGDCRRHPPRLKAGMVSVDETDPAKIKLWESTLYPVTSEDGWCGEFAVSAAHA